MTLQTKRDLEGFQVTNVDELLDEVGKYPFAHRGSIIDPHIPDLGFTINRKIDVWAENLDELYEKAKAQQWNATTDIQWNNIAKLPDDIEKAICQVMTFLVENEYIALYLPAKFLPRINPHFNEVLLFLSTQVVDEARHVEVFARRALQGAGLQYVSSATQHSLRSLLKIEDYAKAKFLLNILGEGTFEDLFTFLLEIVPDAVTRDIIKLAKRDESRHVAYGVMRTKYQLKKHPELKNELLKAIEERASYLYAVAGGDQFMSDALATLAGGGSEERQKEFGLLRIRDMHDHFHQSRVRRLILAGFDRETATKISELHSAAVKSYM